MADKVADKLKGVPPYDDEKEESPVEEKNEEEVKETVEEVEETAPEDKQKERTRQQVEKLTEHNQKLNEENKVLKKNLLESLRPDPAIITQPIPQPAPIPAPVPTPNLTPEEVKDIYEGLVDKDGYVDMETLKKSLKDRDTKAKEAIEEAQKAKEEAQRALDEVKKLKDQTEFDKRSYEENKIMLDIHQQYPQLDPASDKFDETLFDAVRNELISQLRGGEIENVRAAAEKWYGKLYPVTRKDAQQKEEQKSQINAMGRGVARGTPSYESAEFERLKEDSKFGKKGSLAERLRRAGQ